jgi:hypothetical protein
MTRLEILVAKWREQAEMLNRATETAWDTRDTAHLDGRLVAYVCCANELEAAIADDGAERRQDPPESL